MRQRSPRRTGWILGSAAILLLAGPAILLWYALQPQPWDAAHLRVLFQTVRYERAGLVFTYRLENRTRRSARLTSDQTTIRVKQAPDQPAAGYPVIHLPLEIAPQSSSEVEVRLELPLPRDRSDAEQTARVLEHHLPGPHDLESPLAPLPMTRPQQPEPPPSSPLQDVDARVGLSLSLLDGFELINETSGLRIIFPRGW
jgi:hypothetical protein